MRRGGIWIALRAELRRHRASFVIAIIAAAVAGGAAMTAAAGARRSSTAYSRFVAWTHSPDLFTTGADTDDDLVHDLAAFESAPWAEEVLHGGSASLHVRTAKGEDVPAFVIRVGTFTGARGHTMTFRDKLLHGRRANPQAVDEGMLGFSAATKLGAHAGDEITLVSDNDPQQVFRVKVAGIAARPGEFPTLSGSGSRSLDLTEAFQRAHPDLFEEGNKGLAIRVRPGVTHKEIESWIGEHVRSTNVVEANTLTPAVKRTIGVETTALWIVAALVALVFVVLLLQLLLRQTTTTSHEVSVLTGLGMTRAQIVALGAARGAIVGVVGAFLAAMFAVVASPLTPVGLGRIAEPAPGVRVDVSVLVLGAGLVFIASTLAGAYAVISVRRRGRRASARARGPMFNVSRARLAALQMWVRHARRRDGALVRSTVGALLVIIAAVIAVLVTLSSLAALHSQRHLVGATWDGVVVPFDQNAEPNEAQLDAAIATVSKAKGVAAVTASGWTQVRAGDRSLNVQTFDDGGRIAPAILSGRAPSRAGEIAIGGDDMRRLHAHIGDEITIASDETQGTARVRIVGQSVLIPPVFFEAGPGEGIATNTATMRLLGADRAHAAGLLLIRFDNDSYGQADVERLQHAVNGSFAFTSRDRTMIEGIDRVRTVPRALIGVLALLGLVALFHAYVTSARRRSTDVGVVQALGFTRRQVVAAFAALALTMVAVAVLLGVPLGALVGRLGWSRFASYLNVVPRAALTPGVLAGVALVTLAAALAIAVPVAFHLTRVRAADLLRAEE